MIAGFVTGGLAVSERSSLDEFCVDGVCDLPLQDDVDRYNMLRGVSTGTFIAGGVLLAGGLLTLVFAPSGDDQGTVGLQRGGLQLTGRF